MAGNFKCFPALSKISPSLSLKKNEIPQIQLGEIKLIKHQKMQIQVKCGCDAESCPEWAIVEVQGVVESQPSVGDRIQNLEIGRLCCTPQASPPLSQLTIFLMRYLRNYYYME